MSEPPSILSKAFDLLRAFNATDRVLTLTELSRAARLPKSTVHRLLARLVELDAVEHHGNGYKLSLGLMQLGATTPASVLRDLALPHLATLHGWTGETVHLGVLRKFDVFYLERLARPNSPSVVSRVGARLPANCTAIGKAMLAWEDLDDLADFLPCPMPMLTPQSTTDVGKLIGILRRVKADGVARDRDEAMPGLSCLAAPIVVKGSAIGAVSLAYRSDAGLKPRAESLLRETAAHVARDARASLTDGRRLPYEFWHSI